MANIKNRFSTILDDYAAPPTDFEAVTKHDTNNFSQVCRAIYVGGAGDVAAVALNDSAYVFSAVPAGTYIIGFFKRVNATGTTATNMIAMS